MMATEATTGRPVDDTVTSDSEPSIKINDAAHNVDDDAPSVNGAVSPDDVQNKILTDIVDDLVNSADPSISGGSDTENSRTDQLKKDGDKGHLRTSSAVKKPATFKSLSVNKTFLAAKGAGTAAQAKLTDKPAAPAGLASTASTTASSSLRPRLVAKSGGLVARAAGASGPATAPDPSVVWNKNRPVPPPEPKKFTDEELKKHGIHMATRLQSGDAPPGQSNWADIDDDDDWVPEEIRWTDGKVSTIHGEEPVMPNTVPVQPMPTLPVQAKPAEMPQIPTPQPAPISAPAVAAEPTPAPAPIKSAVLQSGRGLVLKGAPEKPTLVAKPPAPPTPVKSPWATLPPVDKASPVLTDLPQPVPLQRYQMRAPDMPQGPTPPPYKEIAADDFSRASFRDGPSHSNRELYNSHSGRLEPVMDRRGGPRGDSYMKQPPAALLQRSSQSDHPEPSAAFQTHRTSGQEGPYGRRRGSSIVSGGSSGMLAARMAQPHDAAMPGPPSELLVNRRGSLTAVSDSPSSPRNYSPSGQRFSGQQPWMPRPSPSMSHATPYNAASQAPYPPAQQQVQHQAQQQGMGGNTESELEMQKRIMREGREAAKQRRLQEEERLEAEKKERIRLKLEALGPAPERKSAKKEAPIVPSARNEADGKTMELHNSSRPIEGQQRAGSDQNVAQNSSADATTQILPNGQPSQSSQFSQSSSAEHALAGQDSQHPDSQSIPQSQPWQSGTTSNDRLSTWGAAAQQAQRNVWGAPSNTNRILGNGTFSTDLNRVASDSFPADVNMMPPSKPVPGPIGPPGPRATSTNIQPIGPPKPVGKDAQAVRNAWASAVKNSDVEINAEQRNKRLEQNRELAARGLNREDLASSVRHSWKPTVVGSDGRRIEKAVDGVVVHKSSGLNDGKDTHTAEPTPAQPPQPAAAAPTARSSRFFPAQDIRKEEAAFAEQGRSQSPSPPPPDMFGHPAFDGDMARPHVSLPQPRIVVRLPPKDDQSPTEQHGAQSSRQMFGATSGAPPGSSAPSNWKSKIKDLLKGDKPVSVPRTLPAVMNSDSLTALFSKHQPNLNNGVDGSVETKKPSVDCFGEQEMGSLPVVSVPRRDLYQDMNYVAVTEDNELPRTLMVKPNSVETRHLMRDCFGHFRTVPVKLEGMETAKEFHLPPLPGREKSNPRERNFNRGGRGRGRGPPSHGGQSSASGPSSSTSGRGNYRQRNRSENWSRGTATVQT